MQMYLTRDSNASPNKSILCLNDVTKLPHKWNLTSEIRWKPTYICRECNLKSQSSFFNLLTSVLHFWLLLISSCCWTTNPGPIGRFTVRTFATVRTRPSPTFSVHASAEEIDTSNPCQCENGTIWNVRKKRIAALSSKITRLILTNTCNRTFALVPRSGNGCTSCTSACSGCWHTSSRLANTYTFASWRACHRKSNVQRIFVCRHQERDLLKSKRTIANLANPSIPKMEVLDASF